QGSIAAHLPGQDIGRGGGGQGGEEHHHPQLCFAQPAQPADQQGQQGQDGELDGAGLPEGGAGAAQCLQLQRHAYGNQSQWQGCLAGQAQGIPAPARQAYAADIEGNADHAAQQQGIFGQGLDGAPQARLAAAVCAHEYQHAKNVDQRDHDRNGHGGGGDAGVAVEGGGAGQAHVGIKAQGT